MHNFNKRREKLARKISEKSAIILFSGVEIKSSADAVYPFVVNRNFYYLTGIKQEQSILVITKIGKTVKETLFTLAFDKLREVWTGRRITKDEALQISEIKNQRDTENFSEFLDKLLKKVSDIYLDLEPGINTHNGTLTSRFADELAINDVKVHNIYNDIMRLRMVKDDYEISLLQDSITLTNEALQKAISIVQPGIYEYEVAAMFEYHIKKHHGELGFATIAASGANGVILHYPDLDAKLQENDLLLLDLGGHNNMYTTDISRTVPVGPHMSALQKTIYEIVLACNKAVINYIKPGLTLLDLQSFTKTFLKEQLVAEKVIKSDDDITNYYYV